MDPIIKLESKLESVKKEGEVITQMNITRESLHYVVQLLNELEETIQPVLSPDSELEKSNDVPKRYIATVVGKGMYENNELLDAVINRIQSIKDRVCL